MDAASPPRQSASLPPASHPLPGTAPSITGADRAALSALAQSALGAPLAPGASTALVDLLVSGCAPSSVTAVLGAVCRTAGR